MVILWFFFPPEKSFVAIMDKRNLAKFGYWSERKVEKHSLKKQLEISVSLLLSLFLSLTTKSKTFLDC